MRNAGDTHTSVIKMKDRASEVSELLDAVHAPLVSFIERVDSVDSLGHGKIGSDSLLIDVHSPRELQHLLNFSLPEKGRGKPGLMDLVDRILRYSVNTWDQGFMHKLSGSTNAVGVVSELILAVLNANLHVYEVSPVLTTIEKQTSRALAALFGLKGPYAGGVTQPGGSASNATAVVVARSCLYPKTKVFGYKGKKFILFTSEQGHYSFEKAALMCGLGSSNAWKVPSDEQGRMKPAELRKLVSKARTEGFVPFFVNATAGTTVLGAYDPLPEIAAICKQESLWFHVDASWGGSVIFSAEHKHKMRGAELAGSLTVNPHKMMGVPLTCSFLLTADLRKFKQANSLPAGYLFHDSEGASSAEINDSLPTFSLEPADEFWDLGDLTLQCGRKGDSLKLALSWAYYGSSGYSDKINHAFTVASYCANLVAANEDLLLISSNPPPCLQVCFYFAPGGVLAQDKDGNSKMTVEIAKRLPQKGFMVDYAPGKFGFFFRPVVHLSVEKETIERLVTAVTQIGMDIYRSKTLQVY